MLTTIIPGIKTYGLMIDERDIWGKNKRQDKLIKQKPHFFFLLNIKTIFTLIKVGQVWL